MLSHPRYPMGYNNKLQVTVFLALNSLYILFKIEFGYPYPLLFKIWYQELNMHNGALNLKDAVLRVKASPLP